LEGRRTAHDLCFEDIIFQDGLAGIDLHGISDEPAKRIGRLIILLEQLLQTHIFPDEGLVGLFQLEVIFDPIVFLIDATGDLGADIHKSGFVELVIPEEEGKGDYLQHQEEEKVKMPSDEEKNVTHLI